jgi:L-cystine uptake protein TcyP (sodium:dicarboxylate symporter family)
MLFYVTGFLIVNNMTLSISCKRFTENKLLTYLQTSYYAEATVISINYLDMQLQEIKPAVFFKQMMPHDAGA